MVVTEETMVLDFGPAGRTEPVPIPPGDAGLRFKLQAMRGLIRGTWDTPEVAGLAWRRIREEQPAKDVFALLQERMAFQADPEGEEVFYSPAYLAGVIAQGGVARGDCDDRAMLGAALLLAAGFAPVLSAVRVVQGGEWVHVYTGLLSADHASFMPLDPQERRRPGEEVSWADRQWVIV